MGYDNMDHGGWVQDQIDAVRGAVISGRRKWTAKDLRAKGAGKGWAAAPIQLNDFQHRAFRILGIAGGGIYNAPISWDGLSWGVKFIYVPWAHELATFDFQALSSMVFLAHDAAIRVAIQPHTPRHLLIGLFERVPTSTPGDLRMTVRHPTLKGAVEAHRERFPFDHPIHALVPGKVGG